MAVPSHPAICTATKDLLKNKGYTRANNACGFRRLRAQLIRRLIAAGRLGDNDKDILEFKVRFFRVLLKYIQLFSDRGKAAIRRSKTEVSYWFNAAHKNDDPIF